MDLIILDWDMPVMTGLDVLKWLEEEGQNENMMKLMLTARAGKDNVLEAVDLGANNYIVKPFSPDTLLSKVEQMVKEFHE